MGLAQACSAGLVRSDACVKACIPDAAPAAPAQDRNDIWVRGKQYSGCMVALAGVCLIALLLTLGLGMRSVRSAVRSAKHW